VRVAEKGVKWIKYETKAEEMSKIQTAIFFLIFINDGIALLLINSNFTGLNSLNKEKKGIIYFLFDGSYTDLSDEWFENISYFFISPLFLETFMPIIDWFIKDFFFSLIA